MKTTKQSDGSQKRRGIAVLWVTLLLLLLIGFAGLIIDAGRMFMAAHQLHNTADAAALAGSRNVAVLMNPDLGDSPEKVADTYALKHTAANVPVDLDEIPSTLPDGTEISSVLSSAISPYDVADDIVIGRYIDHSQLFVVDRTSPDSMLVIARRTGDASQPKLPLLFGPIFGLDTVNMKRYAIAKVIAPFGAGLIALGECDCPGISFSGVGDDTALSVLNGGSVHINSFMEGGREGALDVNSKNILLDVERMVVVGGANDKFYDSMDSYPDAYADADMQVGLGIGYVEPDPYAALPDAVYDPTVITEPNTISASGTYSPGYYPGGLQVSSGDIFLQPGNYYLDSVGEQASMSMTGGTLTGEGVTLHIVGDADKGLDIRGSVIIDISAPTFESGSPYAGIGIFQKRNLDYDCALSCSDYPVSEFNGSGEISIDGAVYMPHNKLDLGGTGGIFITRAVADRFKIYGTGEKIINYKGEPEIVEKSYLVE